jgi:hypothetical protein
MGHDSGRRQFLAALATLSAGAVASSIGPAEAAAFQAQPKPHGSEFVFARLRYTSGDWDFNPKVAANVLNSLVEYTTIPVYGQEVVISADSKELFAFPFIFMTGHKLVRFSKVERDALVRYVEQGGLLFSDDCNHDVSGLYATSFEQEMRTLFPPQRQPLAKLANTHALYHAFFKFPEGPPQTSHELNGWGDDMVHDYLKAIEVNGRIGVLYSNKDYGCEWDYEWKNKRFQRDDNTKFAVNVVAYAMTA